MRKNFFLITGTFPIDTTKTRLQLQGQVIDMKQKEIRYRGMLHAFARIAKDDGLKALFNGYLCSFLIVYLVFKLFIFNIRCLLILR